MRVPAPHVLFFVPEWPALDSSILHAQVLSVAGFLAREGYSCQFAGAETSLARAREAASAIERDYGVKASVGATLSIGGGAYALWRSCRAMHERLRNELAGQAISHVYARSFLGSMWARRLARTLTARSVFDVRAFVGEEQRMNPAARLKAVVTEYLEKREIRLTDRVATVSQNLRNRLEVATGRRGTIVIPSCFDDHAFYYDSAARQQQRAALGLDDTARLICYSGGTSAWQRIDDIIAALKRVCMTSLQCKALFLTPDQAEVTRRLQRAEFPTAQAFVRGCAHKDVYRYLSAADAGIIMRHDTPVNNVASPVKVAEYLACGLPVIMTRGIGDYSELLPAAGVGLLLDETSDITGQILHLINCEDFPLLREQAMSFARSRLTMSANRDHYNALYATTPWNGSSQC